MTAPERPARKPRHKRGGNTDSAKQHQHKAVTRQEAVDDVYRAGFACFVGRPNAGKSTLTNAIVGQKIAITSSKPQTTRHVIRGILHRPDAQLIVIDTPGLRQFELWGVEPAEVGGRFIEFRPFLHLCKFPDCSHTHEAECAVKDAVHWGQIHDGRYESYLKLYHQQPIEGD